MSKQTHPERRVLAAALVMGAVAVFVADWLPDAAAQTHGRSRAKPKPSASAAASVSATLPTATAQPSAVPAPRGDTGGDGGVRASPLNPTPQEMPGTYAAAAAVGSAPPAFPTAEYDRLVAEIAALRARVADVGDAVFVARIAVAIETDGDHSRIGHLAVELDDGVVFTAPAVFGSPDPTVVYERAVAPGHHTITVDVDRKDDRDDTFRDSQRTRFVVDVPKDQRLAVTLRIGDASDMGGSFPSDHKGKYDLRVRMNAAASPVKR